MNVIQNTVDKGIQRNVLLISPLTFSYHESISKALVSLGYKVIWWNDRAENSTAYKLGLRLFPKFTIRISEKHFLRKLKAIEADSITDVLVIKGEGLSTKVVGEMKNTLKNASFGLHLWDGINNAKGAIEISSMFDAVSTFDPVDARKYKWHYRPLFSRKVESVASSSMSIDFHWSFIGTIHSDRHKVISRLRNRYKDNYKSYVFAYFQSPLILKIRKLIDWSLWTAPAGTLSTQPMSAVDVSGVVGKSIAVLDIEHPKQNGLTMRTIETLLAGKKLVTTNKHIVSTNLYHPSRIFILDRNNPEIDAKFFDSEFLTITDDIREYFYCENWVSELIGYQNKK